jgi:hypothetical protein
MNYLLSVALNLLLAFAPFGQYVSPAHSHPPTGTTWTLVQGGTPTHNFTCSGTATGNHTCTVSGLTATTAGNLLVISSSIFSGTGATSTAPSFVSASGDGTWTHPGSCSAANQYSTAQYEAVDLVYILSATGGATSVSFVWTTPTGTGPNWNIDVKFYEWHRSSGTAVFDTCNATTATGASNTAPALASFSGANAELLIQGMSSQNTIGSINGSYTSDIDSTNTFGGYAYLANQTTYTQPTWTVTSGGVAMHAAAFK